MGWDTVDELLSSFGWKSRYGCFTDCKTLETNSANLQQTARYKQGETLLGYGL
jgi:hypothetical protein